MSHGQRREVLLIINGDGVSKSLMSPSSVRSSLLYIQLTFLLPQPLLSMLFSHVRLFATPWTAAHQASLSFTISQSLLKLMFIESAMPSNHLLLCHPFLLLPSIFPSIRDFSSESAPHIRWPKYSSWSFSFSISPSSEYSALIVWLCRVLIVACVIFTAMSRLHSACGV